jgi:hypothetical protein
VETPNRTIHSAAIEKRSMTVTIAGVGVLFEQPNPPESPMFFRNKSTFRRSLVFLALIVAPLSRAQDLQSCGATHSQFAAAWKQFAQSLVLTHPTEIQNLVDLRLQINSLRSEKLELIGRIRTVADLNDTPGWLEARLDLNTLGDHIDSTLDLINQTARQGGWFAGSPLLGELLVSLRSRKGQAVCELARIPFPLSPADKARLTNLLDMLDQETLALGDFDKQLGELIRAASKK